MKKRTQPFVWSMILFYFLSTSLLNWINGEAYNDLPFYIFVLVLAGVCLNWIIKIIKSPHIVKTQETHAPMVLTILGIIFALSISVTSWNLQDLLQAIYILSFFTSMAYLINWYKSTGTVEIKHDPEVELEAIKEELKTPRTAFEKLRDSIRDAKSVTANGTDNYKYLNQALMLSNEIIDKKIEVPEKVVRQMDTVLQGYVELILITIKTQKVFETLKEIEESFPLMVTVLTNIYDSGLNSKLTDIEIESETFKEIVDLSGLNDSDFKSKTT